MKKTNHILWAIITILTGGIGAIAWIAITLSNNQYNKKHQVIGVYVEEEKPAPVPDKPFVVVIGAVFALALINMLPVTEWINEFTNSTHGEDAPLILSIGVVLATAYEIYKYLDFTKKNSL